MSVPSVPAFDPRSLRSLLRKTRADPRRDTRPPSLGILSAFNGRLVHDCLYL